MFVPLNIIKLYRLSLCIPVALVCGLVDHVNCGVVQPRTKPAQITRAGKRVQGQVECLQFLKVMH